MLEMVLCEGCLPCRCYEIPHLEWDSALYILQRECNLYAGRSDFQGSLLEGVLSSLREVRRELVSSDQRIISELPS